MSISIMNQTDGVPEGLLEVIHGFHTGATDVHIVRQTRTTVAIAFTKSPGLTVYEPPLWLCAAKPRNHGVGSPDHIQESDISMLYYLSHSHFIYFEKRSEEPTP